MHQHQQFTFQKYRIHTSFESANDDSPYKQRQLFITQRSNQALIADLQHHAKVVDLQYQANLNKIQESHNELNKYIDKLDERVRQVVDYNEAEILFAYKNHVALVKREMEEIRKQTQTQSNSSSVHLQRIEQLEKKLAIFRGQSLILFRKVIERDKTISQLKIKISELQNEKAFMDQSLKGVMKRNKEIEVQLNQQQLKGYLIEEDFTQKFDVSMIQMNNMKGRIFKHKARTALTSTNLSKGITINTQNNDSSLGNKRKTIKSQEIEQTCSKKFGQKLRLKIKQLPAELLNNVVQKAQLLYFQMQRQNIQRPNAPSREKGIASRATKISMRSKSNCTIDYEWSRPLTSLSVGRQRQKQETSSKQRDFIVKNEISEYFMQCVEAIKKEIIRKKNANSLSFYKQGNPVTLNEFKKLDWFRLMQLFLTEEKVIEELYKTLISVKNS